MKRVIRSAPVESSTIGNVVKTALGLLERIFNGLEKTIDTIVKWDGEGGKKEYVVLEILPSSDDEDWDTSQLFRMLVRCTGKTDEYKIFDFYMKPVSDDDNVPMESETGVKFDMVSDDLDEDASEEDIKKDLEVRTMDMLNQVASDLLKDLTDNEYEDIAEIRVVNN